jgi:hypothetical protein
MKILRWNFKGENCQSENAGFTEEWEYMWRHSKGDLPHGMIIAQANDQGMVFGEFVE